MHGVMDCFVKVVGKDGRRAGLMRCRCAAFSMIEVLFAMLIVGMMVVALYAAIATSTSWLRDSQENQTVNQIMSEKLDTIRLYNWDQINSNGFIQTNFTVGNDPARTNSSAYYTGRVALLKNPVAETYASNLVQVTVNVAWVSPTGRAQNRSMSTFVTTYGIQSFVNP